MKKERERSKKIAKGLGARYGFKVRRKYGEVAVKYRKAKYECPGCSKIVKMKRIAVGIWKCPKCNFTFTGGAYSPKTTR